MKENGIKKWLKRFRKQDTSALPAKTEREKRLERQWADMLRYEGRPLRDGESEGSV